MTACCWASWASLLLSSVCACNVRVVTGKMWICGLYTGLKCRCLCGQNPNPIWPIVRSAVHILREACVYVRDATHVDWVKAWSSTMTQLQTYIKQFHTTGVEWNKQVSPCTLDHTVTSPAQALTSPHTSLAHRQIHLHTQSVSPAHRHTHSLLNFLF